MREGRLEVQLRPGGRWGSVCEGHEEYVDIFSISAELQNVARAACRQLGLAGGVLRDASVYTPPGGGLQPSIANVRCGAQATNLSACALSGFNEAKDGPSCSWQLGVACPGAAWLLQGKLFDIFILRLSVSMDHNGVVVRVWWVRGWAVDRDWCGSPYLPWSLSPPTPPQRAVPNLPMSPATQHQNPSPGEVECGVRKCFKGATPWCTLTPSHLGTGWAPTCALQPVLSGITPRTVQ